MLPLRTLFQEVHRRGLWQAAAAFLGMGWAVLEVMDLFTGRGLLPDWTFTGALVVLALGLPVVLATAYVQTPARGPASRPGESRADPSNDPVNSSEAGSPGSQRGRGRLRDVFTWKRAALGGVVAFAVLGFIAAGFGVMRVTGIGAPGTLLAQGIIEEGGLVILADFQSSANSDAPSDLVTEALRIDLEQSPIFDLMDPRVVAAGLGRMVRNPEDPFSEDVALELAVREGAELVVSGEVGDIGGSYLVTGRILSAGDGSVLAGYRETARDADDLIDAIDALSAKIRSKMGEALRSVASTDPLSQATTTSVEALRKFSYVAQREPRGAISGPQAKAIIQEALVLDTTFAEAYRYLSILITNFGGSMQQRADAAAKAYAFRDRLSPKKQLLITATYHLIVTGEYSQAARAYESLLELDPLYRVAAINLADVAMYEGDYARAEELLQEGSRPESFVWNWNMMASLAGQKKYTEAEALLDGALEALPDNVFLAPTRAFFFANVGRQKKALVELEAGEPYPEEIAAWPLFIEAGILARQGKLIQAGQRLALADQLLLEIATPPEFIGNGAAGPFISGFMGGDGPRGLAEMQEMLSRVSMSEVEPVDRYHGMVGLTLGLMGERDGAREFVARYDAEVPSEGDPGGRADKAVAQALSEILDGASVASSGLVEAARFVRCARCRNLYLGVGYEFSGDLEGAASSYQAFLDDGFFDASLTVLFFPEPVIHERLGGIYDALGQPEKAVEHYREFASQWSESDPELLPRVERALQRAAALADGAS